MSAPAPAPVISRLSRARERMRAVQVDALVVSHLPNIRYLTGFVGTAGLVVLTPTACSLIVDFRYQTAAKALRGGSGRGRGNRVGGAVPELRRDAGRCAAREWREAHRNRSRVDAGQPIQPSRRRRWPQRRRRRSGVPTRARCSCRPSGLSRAQRVVKDETEIATLREAGRRLGAAIPEAVGLVRAGPVRAGSSSRRRRDAAGATVSSGRHSRPSSRPDQTAPCRMRGRAIGGLRTAMA